MARINGAIPHPALDISDISGVESVAGRYVVFTTVLDALRIVPKHECWLASNRSGEAHIFDHLYDMYDCFGGLVARLHFIVCAGKAFVSIFLGLPHDGSIAKEYAIRIKRMSVRLVFFV